MTKIILASASPRRQELLKQIGLTFEVVTSSVEEKITPGISPAEVVKELSFLKARDIADQIDEPAIIIGADTIVVFEDKILGKPKDQEEALYMLNTLSGKEHQVFTGLSVIDNKGNKVVSGYECTKVTFRQLNNYEITQYIKTGEPMDKAGSYGIQNIGSLFVSKIDGDYFNVVGLPVAKLALVLRDEFGIAIL